MLLYRKDRNLNFVKKQKITGQWTCTPLILAVRRQK